MFMVDVRSIAKVWLILMSASQCVRFKNGGTVPMDKVLLSIQ